jgi:hypothetical protein
MSKVYALLSTMSEGWAHLSMLQVMLKRLAHERIQRAFPYRRGA